MGDSNNVAGFKGIRNVWLVSGTPIMLVPRMDREYAEIFNESVGTLRLGTPSGTVGLNNGILLPSGGYITDQFSSDDWWGVKMDGGGSGSVSSWWVEGL